MPLLVGNIQKVIEVMKKEYVLVSPEERIELASKLVSLMSEEDLRETAINSVLYEWEEDEDVFNEDMKLINNQKGD